MAARSGGRTACAPLLHPCRLLTCVRGRRRVWDRRFVTRSQETPAYHHDTRKHLQETLHRLSFGTGVLMRGNAPSGDLRSPHQKHDGDKDEKDPRDQAKVIHKRHQ